jgi:hypothetical protein
MLTALRRFESQLGTMGAVLAVVMFTSLIEIAWNNYRGNTAIWIQPSMTIINNTVWLLYGLSRNDIFLVVANSAGIFFAMVSIIAIFL